MRVRWTRLRTRSPAPTRSMAEPASSATTRARRTRFTRRLSPPRPLSLNPSDGVEPDTWRSGARPNTIPVAPLTSSVNSRTVPSSRTSARRGSPGAPSAANACVVVAANARPATPPANARMRPSVSSWRASRTRPAPSETRTAISRLRPALRTRTRFATFAHVIANTRSTTAPTTSSAARIGRETISLSESTAST
jgi:hypothetical protein